MKNFKKILLSLLFAFLLTETFCPALQLNAKENKGTWDNPFPADSKQKVTYEDYEYYPKKNLHAKGKFKVVLTDYLTGNKAWNFLYKKSKDNLPAKDGYQWIVLK